MKVAGLRLTSRTAFSLATALREQIPHWPHNSNARTGEMAKEISISQIPIFPLNLSGLVLFCIDTSDSESRRIFQHFSRSTRLSHLCTASVLIFVLFCTFSLNFPDFWKIYEFFRKSSIFRRKFHGISPELREIGEGKFSFSSGKRENGGYGEKGK